MRNNLFPPPPFPQMNIDNLIHVNHSSPVPSKPQDLRGWNTSEYSILVTWKKPVNVNGDLKGYKVYKSGFYMVHFSFRRRKHKFCSSLCVGSRTYQNDFVNLYIKVPYYLAVSTCRVLKKL